MHGVPSAILHIEGAKLSARQQALLAKLPEYDSRVTVKKSDVSMRDLSALTAKTGVEFAMFTRKQERLIIRGNDKSVNINPVSAVALSAQGYRWSGHTHVGRNLIPSDGDRSVLNAFSHNKSVIYNSYGKYYDFHKE